MKDTLLFVAIGIVLYVIIQHYRHYEGFDGYDVTEVYESIDKIHDTNYEGVEGYNLNEGINYGKHVAFKLTDHWRPNILHVACKEKDKDPSRSPEQRDTLGRHFC